MCGIAGFYQSHFDYLTEEDHYRQILEELWQVQDQYQLQFKRLDLK